MHLTAEQIAQYDALGYVVIPDFLSPDEVGLLSVEADVLGTPQRGLPEGNVYEMQSAMIRKTYSFHQDSEPFGVLTRLPRMLVPARQLLGEDIYLYMTHMNHKVAERGEQWLWHADYPHWRLDGVERGGPRDMLTIMIMVDDSTPENGPLQILAGSHVLPVEAFPIDTDKTSVPTVEVDGTRMAELLRGHEVVECTGKAGTAVLFAPNAVHGSAENRSSSGRRNAYVVYNREDNRPTSAPRRDHVSPLLMNQDPVPLDGGLDDGALRDLARRRGVAA